MIISIEYDAQREAAIMSCEGDSLNDNWHWNTIIENLYQNASDIIQQDDKLVIPIHTFISLRLTIASYVKSHRISLSISNEVKQFLTIANTRSYGYALKKTSIPKEVIQEKLNSVSFHRQLTDNQVNNLCKLAPLPSGATFSVPGAGKTTEALAYFFLNAIPGDKLFVVAPKNAFGAWDEQLSDCTENPDFQFVRLRGGYEKIDKLLRENPAFSIITYQQYPRVADLIERFLRRNNVFMFLDESHRIKSGNSGISAESILRASFLPKRKLIMSGTPMPQSIKDLIPQFHFLYPDRGVNETNVVSLMNPVYVRTTSGQLGIPSVEHRRVLLTMSPLQSNIYQSIKNETKRQLMPLLSDLSKASLREINKKIMKVMQFVSNPALLSHDMEYIFDPQFGELLAKETGPKIDYACKRARELASEGKKVIIWSQFVENVELIAGRLKDLGADYIHGGVDAGDEDENDTREWKIKEFHKNPHKMVLVANPAAASEGISLHKVCQYAIYVDRSFNAAHYLQSEDRIHRLGLAPNQKPIVEIIECEGTLDQVVEERLRTKVEVMAAALNDASLDISAVEYDVDYDPDEDSITISDLAAIKKYFTDINL